MRSVLIALNRDRMACLSNRSESLNNQPQLANSPERFESRRQVSPGSSIGVSGLLTESVVAGVCSIEVRAR